MSLEPEKFTIGAQTFELTPFGVREGRRLLARIAQALGPALTSATSSERNVEAAIGDLLGACDPDLIDTLCDACAKKCSYQAGDRWPPLDDAHLDLLFARNYADLIAWLAACLRINFADFLDGNKVSALLGGLAKKSQSKSPAQSTGSSGE